MVTIDLRKYETLGRLFIRFGGMPAALQKRTASPQDVTDLLLELSRLLSLLLKAESLTRLQLVSPEQSPPLLGNDSSSQIQFMKEYLDSYSSLLFSFNRSERQTFVFILENVIEYLRQSSEGETTPAPSTVAHQFIDSRFWFENLFKMVDEKLTINLGPGEDGELVMMDSDRQVPLSPFVIRRGEVIYLFHEASEEGPRYSTFDRSESVVGFGEERLRLAEYLLQSLALPELELLQPGRPLSGSPLLGMTDQIKSALELYQDGQWSQVIASIDQIFEKLNAPAPLLQQMRIVSLLHLQHSTEAINEARLFLSQFPAYTSLYEVIAEAYEQKGDYNAALSAYERAAQFSRKRNLTVKIKDIKQRLKEKKEEPAEETNEYLVAITAGEEQQKTMLKRHSLLRQMVEVLGSGHRPNLLLVGEGGTGKSSLIRQLAQELTENPAWQALFPFKDIRSIQFVHLLTGSKYRGQFEEKVLALLNEAEKQKILLVVEDIHLLFSQGGARGTSLDFINIVRPFLQEKKLQMVATTHYEELKNTLERDNAFLGCFHQVIVRPLDDTETMDILRRVLAFRREQWNVDLPGELLQEIMDLSRQLLRNRAFPDAPLLLLDRVYAKIRFESHFETDLSTERSARELLAETARDMANLPPQPFGISVQDRLRQLEKRMSARIIGQDKVLGRMISRIRAYKKGLKIRANRPDGVFLLVGPTGVGKTETALVLAEELIGSRDALLRIDMSEYMEKYTYSRFIGAAPGYVGYNDTNQLTDKVRQNPMTIILLDEVEKADPQLLNIFLQVFDAGRLTDARGRMIDFSGTVILMTSNVGTEMYGAPALGYQEHGRNARVGESSLLKMIRKRFSPEFLNRLDDILVYSPLDDASARHIVELQLEVIKKQLIREGKLLLVTPGVIGHLAREGVSPQYGARQLTRIITQTLLEPLAVKAQSDDWQQGNLICCDLNRGEMRITIDSDLPRQTGVEIRDEANPETEMECDS